MDKFIEINDADCFSHVEKYYDVNDLLKRLRNRWNTQKKGAYEDSFLMDNRILKSFFSNKPDNISLEDFRKIQKKFSNIVEDAILDTCILLKDSEITVYDITKLSFLVCGKVLATLKSGKTYEVFSDYGDYTKPLIANDINTLYLVRPNIEEYYCSNVERFPMTSKFIAYIEAAYNYDYEYRKHVSESDKAKGIQRCWKLTIRDYIIFCKELDTMFKECGYQLRHAPIHK